MLARCSRGTPRSRANHQNHVTALHLFLERLNACWDVKAEPWNMRELKQKPLWLEANSKIITRDPHANDADVCQYDQYTLDTTHDPEAQPMGYLTLPPSGGTCTEKKTVPSRDAACARVHGLKTTLEDFEATVATKYNKDRGSHEARRLVSAITSVLSAYDIDTKPTPSFEEIMNLTPTQAEAYIKRFHTTGSISDALAAFKMYKKLMMSA